MATRTRRTRHEIEAAFADLDPLAMMNIREAAERLGISPDTVQTAIQQKRLKARIPAGLDPAKSGRFGYLIQARDLRDWFFPDTPMRGDSK